MNRSLVSSLLAGILAAAGTILAPPAAAQQEAPPKRQTELRDEPRSEPGYSTIWINGIRAGYAVDRESIDDEGRFDSTSELTIRLQRMGVSIDMTMTTRIVETLEGKFVLLEQSLEQDGHTRSDTYFFHPTEGVYHFKQDGDRKVRDIVSRPRQPVVTPREAEALFRDMLDRGDRHLVVSTLLPQNGLSPVRITSKLAGETEIEIDGETVAVLERRSVNSAMPSIETVEYLDPESLEPIKSIVPMGGFELEVIRSTAQEALGSDAPGPELMETTLISVPRIPDARDSRQAQYIISVDEGGIPVIDSAGPQRIVERAIDSVHLAVDLDRPVPALAGDILRATGSSSLIDPEDPVIVELADACRNGDGSADLLACTHLVHEHLELKNLTQGLASASDTARSREGDCTEHAVLLTAILRALDVPARPVVGLAYIDGPNDTGFFGFHMWTQAAVEQIDGTRVWRDLDAALFSDDGSDAARISISPVNFAQGGGLNDLSRVMQVLGRLKIEIVEPAGDR